MCKLIIRFNTDEQQRKNVSIGRVQLLCHYARLSHPEKLQLLHLTINLFSLFLTIALHSFLHLPRKYYCNISRIGLISSDKNISFLSNDEAKNSRWAAEYFLLQVLGPGFVIVVAAAVVVAVTEQLHPVKVLVGWEEQGSRHKGVVGWRTRGWRDGRQAGVRHAVKGKRR